MEPVGRNMTTRLLIGPKTALWCGLTMPMSSLKMVSGSLIIQGYGISQKSRFLRTTDGKPDSFFRCSRRLAAWVRGRLWRGGCRISPEPDCVEVSGVIKTADANAT